MIPFAQHREPGGALDDLLDARTDHRIAVSAHQNYRTVAQRRSQLVAALHGSYESDALIHRRATSGEKFAVVMHGLQLDRQHAEDRAPLRVRVRDALDVRTRLQNARMNRPLVGRRLRAAQIVAVEILHDEAIRRYAARADISDGDKRIRAGHAHTDMAVTIGNAFVIENVAGGDQLFRQL